MSIRNKLFLLVACLAVVSVLGFGLLLRNSLSLLDALKAGTEENVQALVGQEAQAVSSEMRLVAEKALAFAEAGETFHRFQQAGAPGIEALMQEHITRAVTDFPGALGGGVWYEPHGFFADRQYYGLYAYRGDGGKIIFTTEYNTQEYDYPNQGWYTAAIPATWDRTHRRDKRIYWSEPYVDEAGTKMLMITVGGVMYGADGKIVGMSTVDISLEHMAQRIGTIKPTPGSQALVVDLNSGLVLAAPATPELRMQPYAKAQWGRAIDRSIAPGTIGTAQLELDGKANTLFFTSTENGMGIGVLVPHDEFYATANTLNTRNQLAAGAVVLVLVVLLGMNGVLLHRFVIAPLGALVRYASAIGGGDLDAPAEGRFSAEMATLRDAMAGMVATLKEKIGLAQDTAAQARRAADMARDAQQEAEQARLAAVAARSEGMQMAADRLESISQEIRTATELVERQARGIKQGSVVQRQRIESTTVAMNQMTASILEIASNAASASTSAGESKSRAVAGADAVTTTLSSMEVLKGRAESLREGMANLGDRAQSIGHIMTVIDDIADQTNLLALNAAIEAARAGDAGRGFAVVADEVRKLAEKTMGATREVGASIGSIQQLTTQNIAAVEGAVSQIVEASALSGRSGQLLREVIDNAQAAAGQVQGIAAASQQQSAASEEVNASMVQINEIAQQTTQGVEESTLAIGALAEQVRALHDLIQQFRTGG